MDDYILFEPGQVRFYVSLRESKEPDVGQQADLACLSRNVERVGVPINACRPSACRSDKIIYAN
jgi:hypothetical protein